MTKEERHSEIMDNLLKQGSILVTELANIMQVSSVTIRKDLTNLEKEGKLYRSHGRAILINPFTNNRTVTEKEKLNMDEKQLIGIEAAKLITPNDSIVLASGTTIHALARNITPESRLTVVTASLQVAEVLAPLDNVELIQLGGIVRHTSLSVVGKYAEMILSGFSFSKLYLGVDGIDLEFGISTTDMREAEINRTMMQTAQKTIVLADSTKFGRRGFAKISNIEDVDMIITDNRLPMATRQQVEAMGIDLVIVGE
jgi:DeoR family transcriptional regulator, aga operon transcriptional repressor